MQTFQTPPGGAVFAFDGIDGSGKTTQIKMLSEALTQRGITHVVCRNPGGTAIADDIREVFLKHSNTFVPQVEIALLLAAKKEQLETVVKPALERGEIVIYDRSELTLYGYQAGGRGYDLDMLFHLIDAMDVDIASDHYFYLKLPHGEAVKRMQARGEMTRLDAQSPQFFAEVAEVLEAMLQVQNSYHVLDATASREETHVIVLKDVLEQIDRVRNLQLAASEALQDA